MARLHLWHRIFGPRTRTVHVKFDELAFQALNEHIGESNAKKSPFIIDALARAEPAWWRRYEQLCKENQDASTK